MHFISGLIPTFDTQHQYHQIQKLSKPSNHLKSPQQIYQRFWTKHENSMPWTSAMVGCQICSVSHARWDAKQLRTPVTLSFLCVCVWLVYLTFQYPARNSIANKKNNDFSSSWYFAFILSVSYHNPPKRNPGVTCHRAVATNHGQ